MSSPVFSNNPDDYPHAVDAIIDLGLTPVLIVIGGSYAINTVISKSDLDIWGCHLEDEPEEISVDADVRLSVLGDKHFTQFISYSLKKRKRESVDHINDPPRRVWVRESFLAHPRIYDSVHAEDFRKELLEVPALTVARYYLEAGDWYVDNLSEIKKYRIHAVRMYLTGTRLLELGELIIDNQVLVAWAGNPSIEDARERLQNEIDKL